MVDISEEEREDGFGLLFADDKSSDGDEENETCPTLVEEEHVRKTPTAGGDPTEGSSLPIPPILRLSLVSSRHSLWGHRLWNAALLLADKFDAGEIPVEGKSVLELGAGAGLPGLICALKGARRVVISDYATSSDQVLMVPIKINIDRIQPEFVPPETLHAVGHVWGHAVEDLLAPLDSPQICAPVPPGQLSAKGACKPGGETGVQFPSAATELERPAGKPPYETPTTVAAGRAGCFDVVILADLLFNRSQHAQLLETCDRCLGQSETATAWVSFSHHDPEKAELDMKFFDLARLKGFVTRHVQTVQMRDLFVENDGMDELRGEVHLWCLTRDVVAREPPVVKDHVSGVPA